MKNLKRAQLRREDTQRETSPPDQDKCTNAAPLKKEEDSLGDEESAENDPEEAEDL